MLCGCWAGDIQTMCYSWPQSDGDLTKQKEKMAGKTQTVLLSMPTNRKITGVPIIYRRAVKVERAACAIGDAFSITGFHLCMYSTDTLHPSPLKLTKTYDL